MNDNRDYALYKGEELLSIGTIEEIAAELNTSPINIRYYKTNAYKRKLSKRKRDYGHRILILLDDEEEVVE